MIDQIEMSMHKQENNSKQGNNFKRNDRRIQNEEKEQNDPVGNMCQNTDFQDFVRMFLKK